ncbi:MAG: class I SAM-dependent methyltransferase [Bacteroidia bacterium]|nr:class I SAM-dependent methyltransferase [Bacteroidia bacterium]
MSQLEKDIINQYAERGLKKNLYTSAYSQRVDAELLEKMSGLMKEYFPPGGTILEIGAGLGGNTNIFKQCGLNESQIFLNELLPDRIAVIKEHHPRIPLFEGNAIDINFGRTFSCVFQSTVFTSVLNQDDREKLAAKMWDLLEPGGFILWYDFIYNNPKNKAVRKVTIGQTKKLFPKAKQVVIQKITLAPPIGRRVGKFYSLFNIRPLRSHILAVFHK